MLAHLRTEAYPLYKDAGYIPRQSPAAELTYDENNARIAEAKRQFAARSRT
ncbi:MAG: hypothetical protein QM736_20235 [Vicinamibacterales bacterium]